MVRSWILQEKLGKVRLWTFRTVWFGNERSCLSMANPESKIACYIWIERLRDENKPDACLRISNNKLMVTLIERNWRESSRWMWVSIQSFAYWPKTKGFAIAFTHYHIQLPKSQPQWVQPFNLFGGNRKSCRLISSILPPVIDSLVAFYQGEWTIYVHTHMVR